MNDNDKRYYIILFQSTRIGNAAIVVVVVVVFAERTISQAKCRVFVRATIVGCESNSTSFEYDGMRGRNDDGLSPKMVNEANFRLAAIFEHRPVPSTTIILAIYLKTFQEYI